MINFIKDFIWNIKQDILDRQIDSLNRTFYTISFNLPDNYDDIYFEENEEGDADNDSGIYKL